MIAKAKNFFDKKICFTSNSIQVIYLFAIIYLALPQFLFTLLCFKWIFKLILIILTILLFYKAFFLLSIEKEKVEIPLYIILITLFIELVILFFSGVGGICGVQMSDYDKANAILSDLVYHPWPVIYDEAGNISVLNYYIAYYIPGALLGKLFTSFHIAEIGTLIWAFIGLNLGFFLLMDITRNIKLKTILSFFAWAGLDWIGVLLLGHKFSGTDHIEQWANIKDIPNGHIANYQSVATGLIWGPQHYIPAIITAFILVKLIRSRNYKLCIFLASVMLFWSPLIAVGIIPFGIVCLLNEKFNLKKFFSVPDILGIVTFAVPTFLYYLSMNLNGAGGSAEGLRGISWLLLNWPIFLLFAILEFGIICFILFKSHLISTKQDRILFGTAFFSLITFLFIDYGECHDFSMRSSVIPWLVIFSFAISIEKKGNTLTKNLITLYLICSCITSLTEYSRLVNNFLQNPNHCDRYLISGNTLSNSNFIMEFQYVGNPDSFFFNYLCEDGFNSKTYNEILRINKEGNYLLYSTEDVNVYFYKDRLFFYSLVPEYYISVQYDNNNNIFKPTNFVYGTLSQITSLKALDINDYTWNKIIIEINNNKVEYSLEDLKQWAYERKWDTPIIISNFTDLNWLNGVRVQDRDKLLLEKTSILDETYIGKNLYYDNEKFIITDVQFVNYKTILTLDSSISNIDELADIYIR